MMARRCGSSGGSSVSMSGTASVLGHKRALEQSLFPGGLSPAQRIAAAAAEAAAATAAATADGGHSDADDPLLDAASPVVLARRRRTS